VADEAGDVWSKDRETEMLGDESGVVWEECGVELPEDACDVKATVFGEGMVAVDEQDEKRERGEQKKPARGRPGGWSRALVWGRGHC